MMKPHRIRLYIYKIYNTYKCIEYQVQIISLRAPIISTLPTDRPQSWIKEYINFYTIFEPISPQQQTYLALPSKPNNCGYHAPKYELFSTLVCWVGIAKTDETSSCYGLIYAINFC